MLRPDSETFSRLALYQESLPDKSVRCLLCPHQCVLQEGRSGICRTRINKQGELFALAYGNPCSLAVDPIEKKPLFHFFPGTNIYSLAIAGCNFRCLNCQNWEISQSSPDALGQHTLTPEEVVLQALKHHTGSIAFTYTEPSVFYEYVLDTAKAAHDKGLKTVLISNGFISEKPLLELSPYIDAANIDLKCFDDGVYRHLAGGRLQPVLDTLKILKVQRVWLEITNLLVPGFSDRPEMVQAMCDWLVKNGFARTPLHFSRFFPTYKLKKISPTSESNLIQAKDIAEASGMEYVYIGNFSGLNGENTYCPYCRHMVVERSSYAVKLNVIRNGRCGFCGEQLSGVWC